MFPALATPLKSLSQDDKIIVNKIPLTYWGTEVVIMENTDIIITATFDVDPKELDDLMARCKPLIDGALEEEGCQDYSWTLDPYVPGRIWVMERWESEEALKKHFDDEWYKNMGATLNEVGLLNAFSAKYKISKQEPVYDDTGTPRADFFSD